MGRKCSLLCNDCMAHAIIPVPTLVSGNADNALFRLYPQRPARHSISLLVR